MITSAAGVHVPQLAAEKCLSMTINESQSFGVYVPRASIQLYHRHNPCPDNHDNHQSSSHEGKSFTKYEFGGKRRNPGLKGDRFLYWCQSFLVSSTDLPLPLLLPRLIVPLTGPVVVFKSSLFESRSEHWKILQLVLRVKNNHVMRRDPHGYFVLGEWRVMLYSTHQPERKSSVSSLGH